jgi:hypothetical protein
MSAYGRRWKELTLVVFSVYVDDSGTDPQQKVAVAAALIVPAIKIQRIEALWETFREKYGFKYLHASELASSHRKGQYGHWSDHKAGLVLSRARQITKANVAAACAFSIKKESFDRVTPRQWKIQGGQNHYTWAFRTLLDHLIRWREARGIVKPFEWVFDNANGRDRDEIEMLMAQFEVDHPGHFEGRYSFRCRANVPCLQAADLLAWSTYSISREIFVRASADPFAVRSMQDFRNYQNGDWLTCLTYAEEQLRQTIDDDLRNAEAVRVRDEWYKNWQAGSQARKTARPKREKCPC